MIDKYLDFFNIATQSNKLSQNNTGVYMKLIFFLICFVSGAIAQNVINTNKLEIQLQSKNTLFSNEYVSEDQHLLR